MSATQHMRFFQQRAALNILRLHNTLRLLRQPLKLLRSYHTRNITFYLTDNTNLPAAVSCLFGNWHEGCSLWLSHTSNLELLERFEFLVRRRRKPKR